MTKKLIFCDLPHDEACKLNPLIDTQEPEETLSYAKQLLYVASRKAIEPGDNDDTDNATQVYKPIHVVIGALRYEYNQPRK